MTPPYTMLREIRGRLNMENDMDDTKEIRERYDNMSERYPIQAKRDVRTLLIALDNQAEYIKALEAVYADVTNGDYCELCRVAIAGPVIYDHLEDCPCWKVQDLTEPPCGQQ